MKKSEYHVVSFSGGKDSTAMLLGMIERGYHIDEIIFCDTGLEFPAMYQHIGKVEHDIGRYITRLKADISFEYGLLEKIVEHKEITKKRNNAAYVKGRSWPEPRSRWCTRDLKGKPIRKHLRELQQKYEIVHYVGLAADEQLRLQRENNQKKNQVHPLVDWGMTEAQCLEYCYQHGYDWKGLYKLFKRVSCWCCPLQPISELRKLFDHYPELWAKLKEWDKQTWRKFRADYSIEQLESRFNFERERLSIGKSIKNHDFYEKLREKINIA